MAEIQELIHAHLFEHAPIMIAVLDQEFRVVQANARFRKAFGEWRGTRCHELLKHRPEPCDRCNVKRSFEDGKVRICEERLQLLDGSTGHFVTRVAPLVAQGESAVPYMIWLASDVNEAEGLQRENELLFEKVPCYVTVLDRELRVVRANRRMRETFGWHRGQHCYEVYKRRDDPCPDCPALKTLADGEDHTAPQVGVTSSGEESHYIVTTAALSRGQGRGSQGPNYVIEMSTDVTQLHTLQKEKLEAERMAAVGQTVAGLAHGMKNILMGMEGGIYVMQSGFQRNQPTKIERGMDMLGRNVEKISTLVKNLLNFSKGTVPQVRLTDPNQVVREIIELYRELARSSGVRLLHELDEGLHPAPLDAEGIHTCLANLVSNAIDACLMSDTPECRVMLKTSEENGVIMLEVSDDGCGMDHEVKKKVFTTFFTTKGSGGTGLGLLMTRKIVQEHGGHIVVDSDPGKGTTFRILLPRDRLPQPGAEISIAHHSTVSEAR